MDSEELRSIQAPIKDLYRAEPAQASITLRATGNVGEGITCSVETGRALVEAGLHPGTGGIGTHVCSGDMLLQALVACAGVTLAAVATALGITIESGSVLAEGDLDFRGTLGVSRDVPVGFKAVRLSFALDTAVGDDELQRLIMLTERYCVVLQTLAHPPTLTVDHRRIKQQS